MLQTTNLSVPTHSSRVLSFSSMPPPSVSGTNPMYVYFDHLVFISMLINISQYAQPVSKKIKAAPVAADAEEKAKLSNHAQRKLDERKKG